MKVNKKIKGESTKINYEKENNKSAFFLKKKIILNVGRINQTRKTVNYDIKKWIC